MKDFSELVDALEEAYDEACVEALGSYPCVQCTDLIFMPGTARGDRIDDLVCFCDPETPTDWWIKDSVKEAAAAGAATVHIEFIFDGAQTEQDFEDGEYDPQVSIAAVEIWNSQDGWLF